MVVRGKPLWIDLGYVKLLDFCYGCRRLGYVLKGCDMVDPEREVSELQYGERLRTSPVKSKSVTQTVKGRKRGNYLYLFRKIERLTKHA